MREENRVYSGMFASGNERVVSRRIPTLSKVLMIVHGVVALGIFASVWANAGGYQNGVQWGILAMIDFPVFFPWRLLPEGQSPLNPALMPELTLNWVTLAYALVFGTLYWFMLGWVVTRLYRRLRGGEMS